MIEKFENGPPHESNESGEKKLLPVTGKEIVEVLTSRKFRELLISAGRFTAQTGSEAGFGVLKEAYSVDEIVFSDLAKSEHLSVSLEELHDCMAEVRYQMKDPIVLAILHLHPGIAGIGPIGPSVSGPGGIGGDLQAYNLYKFPVFGKILGFPVGMIGQVGDDGNFDFLVFQEQFREDLDAMPGTTELLVDEFEEAQTQEDVLRILRENNYKADMVGISKNGEIAAEDIRKLNNFGFQPEIIEET